jgi:hypothetical protein
MAYFAGLALGAIALALLGIVQLRLNKLGADDFSMIWAGPRAILAGVDLYDVSTWRENAVRLGTFAYDTDVYAYPPWVALALTPFALLSPRVAGLVWSVTGIVVAAIAVRALLRVYLPQLPWAHGVVGMLLVASAPTVATLLLGQWTFFLLASVSSVVVLLRQNRPVSAGVVAAVMLAKPPLFVFTAAGLGVRALWPGRAAPDFGRRFVISATGTALAIVAVSWILVPTWWPAWYVHSASVLVGIQPVSLPTLFTTLFGPTGVWLAPLVLFGAVALALQFHPRGDGWLPVWLALSSVEVIYSNTYDLLLLIVPIVLAAGALATRSPRRAAFVVIVGAGLLFVVMWYLHTTNVRGYAEGVSLLIFGTIASALWGQRRDLGEGDLPGKVTDARGAGVRGHAALGFRRSR